MFLLFLLEMNNTSDDAKTFPPPDVSAQKQFQRRAQSCPPLLYYSSIV
jgi:hypothetical protein